jgi:large subunit ribosomal protein L21
MELAVIQTGGKQYLVSPKTQIKIEKIEGKEKEEVIFDKVLFLARNGEIKIGTPYLENVKVVGEIVKQGKSKKITILKFKRKTRYKKKIGHRQPFTEVKIKEFIVK